MGDLKSVLTQLNQCTDTNESASNSLNQSNTTLDLIFQMVDKEKTTIYQKPWNKLEKQYKLIKLNEYCDILQEKYTLTSNELQMLKKYIHSQLNRNNLNKKTIIIYDTDECCIKKINNFIFNESTRTFSLQHKEKKSKISTKTKGNIDRIMKTK